MTDARSVLPNRPRIRLATRLDVEALSRLRVAIFQELGTLVAGQEPALLAACRSAYARLFDESLGIAWAAEPDAEPPVAALTLLFRTRLPSPARLDAGESYVTGVYTAPAWRGRGIATAMMELAIEESRRRGMTRVRLHATESGRRVYTARGFQSRSDAMEMLL